MTGSRDPSLIVLELVSLEILGEVEVNGGKTTPNP